MNYPLKIANYAKAGYPALAINTYEEGRVLQDIRSVADYRAGIKILVWDSVKGLSEELANKSISIPADAQEVKNLFEFLEQYCSTDGNENTLIVLKDFHLQFDRHPNRINYIRHIRNLLNVLKARSNMLIFISPYFNIPKELEKDIQVIDYALPDELGISKVFDFIVESVFRDEKPVIDPSIKQLAIEAAKGMTESEVENAFSLAYTENKGKFDRGYVDSVFAEKVTQVKKNGLLTHIPSDISFNDVGGLEGLKKWIVTRKKAFSKEAQAFGVNTPKGIILAGIMGVGKSLLAKATAREFNCPLFQLDVGALFQGTVGATEENFRHVIQIMDSIGLSVILIDEAEKSLNVSATNGISDSGTSSRSFGTFLSWMSDRKSPVFLVATSNNHTILPPELIRKGRFDEAFWLDLPDKKERAAIFKVVLSKKKRDPKDFSVNKLAAATNLYSGAEIEEVVNTALCDAFNKELELNDTLLLDAISEIEPYAKVNKAVIDEMRKRAEGKLKIASESGETEQFSKTLRKIEIESQT